MLTVIELERVFHFLRKASGRIVPRRVWLTLCRMGIGVSFSQFSEDLWFLMTVGVPARGVFQVVEVGAFDGVRYSNTAMLEMRHNADALLVEASQIQAEKCQRLRPHANTFAVAAGAAEGQDTFVGDRTVSGIKRLMSPHYREVWRVDNLVSHTVPVVRLETLLRGSGVQKIDFLSIDVQGAELEVLRGIGTLNQITCICIELENHEPVREEECRRLLTANGFHFAGKISVSEFWISDAAAAENGPYVRVTEMPSSLMRPYIEPSEVQSVDRALMEALSR